MELGFWVTGFYVTDADGTVTDYVDCLSWDASDEKFFAGTAWRETWFPAITRADDTSWEGVTLGGVPVRAPVILPDCDLSNNVLRLGLITEQGRQRATVPVAIQDSIAAQQ